MNDTARASPKEFDATVICTGATQPRDLPIEGRHPQGRATSRWSSSPPNTKAVLNGGRQHAPDQRQGQGRHRHRRRRHRHRLRGHRRCATAARASCRSRFCPSPRWTAPSITPGPSGPRSYKMDYGQEEAAASSAHDPRIYAHHRERNSSATSTATSKELVTVEIKWAEERQGQFVPKGSPGGTEKPCPVQLVLSPWVSSDRNSPSSRTLERRDRPPHQHQGRARQVHDAISGHLRRRRLPPRPVPRRLGHQRRPRRSPRVRPLPDGARRIFLSPAIGWLFGWLFE